MKIASKDIIVNLKRLTNQVYKLLPYREEGIDWKTPLSNIVIELYGMADTLKQQHVMLFSLICRLRGLNSLDREDDFILFRSTVFECLNLINFITESVKEMREWEV